MDDSPADPRDTDRQHTRAALLALALLGADDTAPARDLWYAHAMPAYRGLLDGDGFVWDDAAQSYRTAHGRMLSPADLKRLMLLFAMAAEDDLRRITAPLAAKPSQPSQTAVEAWQMEVAQVVKQEYVAQAAMAVGGFDNLAPTDLRTVTGAPDAPPGLAFSMDRLATFGEQLRDEAAGSAAEIVNRAGLYAAAGNSVYEEVRRESHKRAKDGKGRLRFLYERNILDDRAVRHCTSTADEIGCVELTTAGWQPIGSLPAPGLRRCKIACCCRLDYSLIGDALGTN
jgi:hypothetical protein